MLDPLLLKLSLLLLPDTSLLPRLLPAPQLLRLRSRLAGARMSLLLETLRMFRCSRSSPLFLPPLLFVKLFLPLQPLLRTSILARARPDCLSSGPAGPITRPASLALNARLPLPSTAGNSQLLSRTPPFTLNSRLPGPSFPGHAGPITASAPLTLQSRLSWSPGFGPATRLNLLAAHSRPARGNHSTLPSARRLRLSGLSFNPSLVKLDFVSRPLHLIFRNDLAGQPWPLYRLSSLRSPYQSPGPDAIRSLPYRPGGYSSRLAENTPVMFNSSKHMMVRFGMDHRNIGIVDVTAPDRGIAREDRSAHYGSGNIRGNNQRWRYALHPDTHVAVDSIEYATVNDDGPARKRKTADIHADPRKADSDSDEVRGRPPAVVGVINLTGGKRHPSDIGTGMNPCYTAGIPAGAIGDKTDFDPNRRSPVPI